MEKFLSVLVRSLPTALFLHRHTAVIFVKIILYVTFLLFTVDGSTDDADAPIKKLFLDAEFVQKYKLGSLNSINWCRVMITVAQHFYAYFQVSHCWVY